MKYIIIVILYFLCSNEIRATQQYPDILIFENKEVKIYTYPLEDVWEKVIKDTSYIEQACMSTACYRLYKATWKIIGKKLYLEKISDCCTPDSTANLELIFGDKFHKNRVFANWFTGRLVIPKGKILYHDYYNAKGVFEYEKLVYLEKGIIKEIKEVSNKNSNIKYFRTDQLSLHVLKNLEEDIKREIWNKVFKLNFYIKVESDKNRRVIGIKYNAIYDINYKENLEEIILAIDDWDVLYNHGEKVVDTGVYNVKIDKKFMRKNKKYWKRKVCH